MKKNILTYFLLLLITTGLLFGANLHIIFTNSSLTNTEEGTFYEFDVNAWVDHTSPVRLLDGHIYVKYNTNVFGSSIAESPNVNITTQGPIAAGAYNIYPETNPEYGVNNKTYIVATTFEAALPSSPSYYEDSYIPIYENSQVTLFHFKMKVANIGEEYGMVGVEWPENEPLVEGVNVYTKPDLFSDYDGIITFDAVVFSNTTSDDIIYYNEGDPALPVTLESFIAGYKQGAVELEWSTASETQNAGFILKRALVNEGESLEYEVITSYLDNDDLTGAGTTTERHVYTYSDRSVRPGAAYSYILEDVDYSGNIVQHDPVRVVIPENVLAATEDFRLQPAYPNPFNPSFTVPFELHRAMDVRIAMYDLSGRQVRSIVSSRMDAGSYDLRVDASDLRSGIYFVRSIIGDQVNTQKMLLVK